MITPLISFDTVIETSNKSKNCSYGRKYTVIGTFRQIELKVCRMLLQFDPELARDVACDGVASAESLEGVQSKPRAFIFDCDAADSEFF